MNWRDTPYAGGFVYTANQYATIAHYKKISLPGGRAFWCDESKTLSTEISSTGNFAIIYGHFVDTLEMVNDQVLAKSLLETWQQGLEEFHQRIDRIAGRYAICIGDSEHSYVYHDATGLRSIYYSADSLLVTSHINLLNDLEPHPQSLTVKGASLSADYTIFEQVWQLVPNFRLAFEAQRAERYFPRQVNRFSNWTREARFEKVEEIWARVMDAYVEKYDKIAISVTGGMDSRLMLAMAKDHWPKLEGFTYGFQEKPDKDSKWAKTMTMDFKIVSKLKEQVNFARHSFVEISEKQPVDLQLRELMKKNTSGRHGFYLVPHYRELFKGDGWLHIRGTGPEIVRRQFGGNSSFESTMQTLTLEGSPDFTDRARALGYDKKNYGYLSKDLAYWELRMGKWHSEILNETDAAYDTLLPMSVREIYEIMMSFSDFERATALPIRELINRSVPEFNFLGMNDPRNLFEQWRDEKLDAAPKNYIFNEKLVSPGGSLEDFDAGEANLLYIPADQFIAGTKVVGDLRKVDEKSNILISFDQGWTSARGQGYFEWQILVDGEPVAKCDGALIAEPIRVKLRNVPGGTIVSLALVALKSPQAKSWEKASKLRIKEINIYRSTEGEEQLIVSADDVRIQL